MFLDEYDSSDTGTNPTSPLHHADYRPYPEGKLATGNNRKPDGYGNTFPRHDIHPATELNSQKRTKVKEIPDLRVNTTCATKVQMMNVRAG